MSNLLKITQQTLWQILGKVVTSLSTFIILGLVARNYGEEGVGVFTLALTYLAIFYLLSDFGFNAHVLKKLQISNYKLQIEEFKKLLGARILWGGVLVILALGLLPFWPFTTSEFAQAVVMGALAIVASGVFVTCNLMFQSKLRYDLSVLASSAGTLVSLGVFIYLVYEKFTVPILLLGHFVGWFAIAALSLFLVKIATPDVHRDRNDDEGFFPILDKQYTINLFKSSWPIATTLALNVVYFRADSFMIAYFRSNAEVGIYNIAYSVFQSVLVLPTFIMNAYYPLMLKSFSLVRLVGLALLGLACAGTFLTVILAPYMMEILTGGGFLGSTQSLQILSLGLPAYFLSALMMWIMVSQGQYKLMLVIYTVGLGFNLVLNYLYIPQYSFMAASWITVISEYLILILQIALSKLQLKD